MRVKKEVIVGIIMITLIASLCVGFLGYTRNKRRNTLAKQIAALSPGNGPPETIQGLWTAINAYEAKIEQHVKDAAQTGVYWKILAYRLQDKGLYGEALEALERAIGYNPVDSALHYMVGVSAGIVAKSSLNFEGNPGNLTRDNYFTLSENAYLRAISLDERYIKPLYGLAVLYTFELGRPREAIPYLLRCLEISPDVDTMFVLARSYYMIESYQEAVAVYERIVEFTRDPDKRNEAQSNRQRILDIIYG